MAKSWLRPPSLRVLEETEEDRHATWLELFYDLVFVVAVAQLAHNLADSVSWKGFLEFIALFIPVWWSWVGSAYYATRFDSDDAEHRLLTALQMFAVAALAVNVHDGLGEGSAGFALSYAAVRFILVLEYLRAGRYVPEARRLIRRYSKGFSLAAALWLVSAVVPPPWRFILWGAGLLVDFGTPITAGQLHAQLPPHTSHLPERFGLFTIIVLGESVAGVVRGVAEQQWNLVSSITAFLGLGIAFCLWWLYFENIGGGAIRAAVKAGRVGTYQYWIYAHLLLAIGIAATGVGIEKMVLISQSDVLPDTSRWLICGSLAACFIALMIIHQTTASEIEAVRLRSESGTVYRAVAALAVLFVAVVGTSTLPVALAGLLALICLALVVMDFYETEHHQNNQ